MRNSLDGPWDWTRLGTFFSRSFHGFSDQLMVWIVSGLNGIDNGDAMMSFHGTSRGDAKILVWGFYLGLKRLRWNLQVFFIGLLTGDVFGNLHLGRSVGALPASKHAINWRISHVCVCMYVCMYIYIYTTELHRIGQMNRWTDRQTYRQAGRQTANKQPAMQTNG